MTNKKTLIYGIYGAGGSGLSLSFFLKNNPNYKNILNYIYFIDDNNYLINKKKNKWFPNN